MRMKLTSEGARPFTAAENAQFDIDIAQFASDEATRLAEEATSISVVEMVEAIVDKLAGTGTAKFDSLKNKKVKNG